MIQQSKNILVSSSVLDGEILIPASKSHTMRAILFASLSDGRCQINNYLPSSDTNAMITACRLLGATISQQNEALEIFGVNAKPTIPAAVIDAQNSGQILHYIGALSALVDGYTILTGDESIRTNRPVQVLLDGIRQLGGVAISSRDNGLPPIVIKGPIAPQQIIIAGEASLPVSAMIIVASFLKGITEIIVKNPGEKPWVNLTLSWLERGGVNYENDNFERIDIHGTGRFSHFNYSVPADFSSAAFPIIAALITQSEITLQNLDMSDVQGDKQLIYTLMEMGANISYDPINKTLQVKYSPNIKGCKISINDHIDSITILAVLGCFAWGETEIVNALPARYKECDRIACIAKELKKMGADIVEQRDGLIIKHSKLLGTTVESYRDHRMALALTVAGLGASGKTVIHDTHCIDKTFSQFVPMMQQLGAKMTLE